MLIRGGQIMIDKIVNITYKESSRLFKYILFNHRDVVMDKWKFVYINVYESELRRLSEIDEIKDEIDKVLDSHVCRCCGTKTTAPFLVSYREVGGCVGRTIDCPICFSISDKHYFKLGAFSEEGKLKFVEGLLKEFA